MSNQNSTYTLVDYRRDFISRQSDSIKNLIEDLDSRVDKAVDSASKVKAYSDLIQFYNTIESPENSACVVFEKAKLINDPNSWAVCGDNFIALLMERKVDSSLVSDVGRYAIESFENSVKLDSSLVSSKLKLAQCYMELASEPMKGVKILLDVTKEDSNNVQAQFLLAKFGLVSGQIEKVLGRLEKVLTLQPKNIEARLMRVDAYMQSGDKELAVKDLKVLKSQKELPAEMKKQIEEAIKDIEKSN